MKKESGKQILKFCIVGTLNAAITYIALWLLPHMGFSTEASNIAGYVIVLIHSFAWSKLWIFKSKSHNLLKESALFVAAFLTAYALQYACFNALLDAGMNKYLANLLSLIVFGVTNFLMNKLLTFK